MFREIYVGSSFTMPPEDSQIRKFVNLNSSLAHLMTPPSVGSVPLGPSVGNISFVRPSTTHIHISTKKLSRSQITEIWLLLKDDRSVKSVRKSRKGSYIELEVYRFLQYPSLSVGSCAAAPCCLGGMSPISTGLAAVLQFMADNKNTIEAVASVTSVAGSAVAASKHVIEKLSDYVEAHKEKFTRIPIYDAQGNVIKFVKRKNEQLK